MRSPSQAMWALSAALISISVAKTPAYTLQDHG